jgi:hypothetical protein
LMCDRSRNTLDYPRKFADVTKQSLLRERSQVWLEEKWLNPN